MPLRNDNWSNMVCPSFSSPAACQCHTNGSESEVCDKETGRCQCMKDVTGRQCDECIVSILTDANNISNILAFICGAIMVWTFRLFISPCWQSFYPFFLFGIIQYQSWWTSCGLQYTVGDDYFSHGYIRCKQDMCYQVGLKRINVPDVLYSLLIKGVTRPFESLLLMSTPCCDRQSHTCSFSLKSGLMFKM